MPAKRTKKNESTGSIGSTDVRRFIQSTDSYKSLIYGVITVVVLFIVIALGIRTLQQNKAQIDEEALSTQNLTKTVNKEQYTVQEGDTLWSIAQKSYNDGYKWTEIAKANNLEESTPIEKGMKLTIPKLAANTISPTISESPTVAVSPTMPLKPTTTVEQKTDNVLNVPSELPGPRITADTYKIVEGDNLWNISIRRYGNGYRWVEIAKLNNLKNPNLIYPGDTLKLPNR